ncbi:MAG: signal peptide peptidase SppA [Proteobacteria bacterium]|nr:MAG: signal peptide peptidase SppA [Pseudomonadota bacterium]
MSESTETPPEGIEPPPAPVETSPAPVETSPAPVDTGNSERPQSSRPQRSRPVLAGALIFFALLLFCFAFVALLMSSEGGSEEGPQIGVVEVRGVITGSKRTLETLRAFRKSERIAAVVVRLNTPGGSVGPSQEVFREIERTRKVKPVVASMGTVAASGGYYIAAACQKIVANPGTLTGSIGVITQTTEVSQLLALARVQAHTMKSGPHKDVGSPLRPLTDEDRRLLQRMVDRIHAQFVRDVAKGRALSEAAVREVATGRLITGEEAKTAKLVDQLGNFSDALDLAAKLAKARGEPIPVYRRRSGGLLSKLLEEATSRAAAVLRSELSRRLRVEARHPGL